MKRRTLILSIVCVAAGSLSYLATVKARPAPSSATTQPSPLLQWLDTTPAQRQGIQKDDPTFEAEAKVLQERLAEERKALASLLQESASTDQQILERLDRANDAEHALERRTTQYVLRVRQHLSPQQRIRLMGLCAEGVRGGGRWRQGTGGADAAESGLGRGQGGAGRGPGPHRGPAQ